MNLKRMMSLLCLSSTLLGCGTGSSFGVSVATQATVTRAPNEVNLIVTVRDGKEPVPDLSEVNFEISENDLELDKQEIGLQLVAKDALTAGLTVLLLDLSGAPDDATLKRMERGASHFIEKVSVTQPVFVVAFDGSPRPREVARFSKVDRATERPVPPLRPFMSTDTSRDLYGALLSAIKGVSAELAKQKKDGKFGTVVTLLRGPDLAGRTAEKDVREAIKKSGYEFYSLSPEDKAIQQLPLVGKTARFEFATIDTLPMQFSDLGMRVRAAYNSHYVVSYCSPARSGERKIKLEVSYVGPHGASKGDSTKTDFDSTGFTGGCEKDRWGTPKLAEVGQSPQETPTDSTPEPKPQETEGASEPEHGGVVAPPDSGKYE